MCHVPNKNMTVNVYITSWQIVNLFQGNKRVHSVTASVVRTILIYWSIAAITFRLVYIRIAIIRHVTILMHLLAYRTLHAKLKYQSVVNFLLIIFNCR